MTALDWLRAMVSEMSEASWIAAPVIRVQQAGGIMRLKREVLPPVESSADRPPEPPSSLQHITEITLSMMLALVILGRLFELLGVR